MIKSFSEGFVSLTRNRNINFGYTNDIKNHGLKDEIVRFVFEPHNLMTIRGIKLGKYSYFYKPDFKSAKEMTITDPRFHRNDDEAEERIEGSLPINLCTYIDILLYMPYNRIIEIYPDSISWFNTIKSEKDKVRIFRNQHEFNFMRDYQTLDEYIHEKESDF